MVLKRITNILHPMYCEALNLYKNCEAAKDSTVLAALGHNFKDGVCTICKEADPNYKEHSTTEESTWNKGDNGGAVIKEF